MVCQLHLSCNDIATCPPSPQFRSICTEGGKDGGDGEGVGGMNSQK